MVADYCWNLQCDCPGDPHVRKSCKQRFLGINCNYLNQLALISAVVKYNAIKYFMRLFLYNLGQFPCNY